jgi:hypothetical protein
MFDCTRSRRVLEWGMPRTCGARDNERARVRLFLVVQRAMCEGTCDAQICEVHANTGTLQVETRRKEGILAGDSGRENNEGKGEMVVNESRLE